jgi:hypothetical protein
VGFISEDFEGLPGAMSDLKKYVVERKRRDRKFAVGFDEGYAM